MLTGRSYGGIGVRSLGSRPNVTGDANATGGAPTVLTPHAGGTPFELPAMSLGEVMVKPTTMLYRNFLAMEVEELLRSLPCDGVVLLAGCVQAAAAPRFNAAEWLRVSIPSAPWRSCDLTRS